MTRRLSSRAPGPGQDGTVYSLTVPSVPFSDPGTRPKRDNRDRAGTVPSVPFSMGDQLRVLARRVERLAVAGRTDPEQVVSEKQLIGRALRRLAKETAS